MSDKSVNSPQYKLHPRSDEAKHLRASNPLAFQVPRANLYSPHFSEYTKATEGVLEDITNRRPHHMREGHHPHYHSEEQDVPVTVPGKGTFSSSSEAALVEGIAKSGVSIPLSSPTPIHDPLITKEKQKRGESGTYLHSERFAAPPSNSSSIAQQPSTETQQSSDNQRDGGMKMKENSDCDNNPNNNELFSLLFPKLFDVDKYMASIEKDPPRHNALLSFQEFIELAKEHILDDSLYQWTKGTDGVQLKSFMANEIMMTMDGVLVEEPVLLGGFIQLIRIQELSNLIVKALEKKGHSTKEMAKGGTILQAELLQLNLMCLTPLLRFLTDWEHRAAAHNLIMPHVKQTVELVHKILRSK